MWSNNKKVDLTVNILLFLVAINFLHYGQLILPVICLILFIDNKFKFNVNNLRIFIILCLFGISFFVFSIKNFYCVMGFTLPMAYYIGSNLKEANEKNIRKLIFIIVCGMMCHVFLNFIYEINIYGNKVFDKKTRYDFWLKDEIVQTLVAVLFTIPFGCTYYLVNFEKNKKIKICLLIGIIFLIIYDVALGRRTPLVVLILSITVSYLLSLFVNKSEKIPKWPIVLVVIIIFVYLGIKGLFAYANFTQNWDLYYGLDSNNLLYKINEYGLDGERLSIIIDAHKIMFKYLWGGMKISEMLGIKIHEFWFDIYDYAGVIPFILMIIYSINVLINQIKLLKNKNIEVHTRIFIATLFICIVAQMCIEPIMTCSTIFLLCSIIILTAAQKLNN